VPYRLIPFVTNNTYHVFNRGVEKRNIFLTNNDFDHFLETLVYYQYSKPKPKFSTYKRFKSQEFFKNPKIVEVLSYCLMPNHFHLLLKQLIEHGIPEFIGNVTNSYTKYFNTKYDRTGHLFQGQFKATSISTDEQLMHISRYIHLNPYVSGLVSDLKNYKYSSYSDFIKNKENSICQTGAILGLFKTPKSYEKFINDQENYAKELENIKHLLVDAD
jgi:putative transposase